MLLFHQKKKRVYNTAVFLFENMSRSDKCKNKMVSSKFCGQEGRTSGENTLLSGPFHCGSQTLFVSFDNIVNRAGRKSSQGKTIPESESFLIFLERDWDLDVDRTLDWQGLQGWEQ